MTDFATFLQRHREKVEPMEQELGDAWWQANIHATDANDARAATAQKELTRVYADRESFTYLRELDAPLSPEEARQRVLLLHSFTGNQMEDAVIEELVDTERRVESQYNNFRPLFRGEPTGDNALRDILRVSEDSAFRREAWEASKEIGSVVVGDVLRLVALRNREARRLGFANYYAMSLELQEQNQDELFALLEDLAGQTDPLWNEYKSELDRQLGERFGVEVSELRPWHYADPFFQEAPPGEIDLDHFYKDRDLEAITTTFFDAIGLDVRDIMERSDLYEREGKCQHAFCIHVGRFGDVRVLCNCTGSERWMGTMLHEFGHAVYDKYLGADLPYFLREPAHTLTTEAIAMLFGRLSRNAAFLHRYAGVPAEEATAVAASASAEARAQFLIFTRWVLVMAHFERALYEDPAQNLNQLWWTLVHRYQGLTPPAGRESPDWAAKIHIALSPVYYHNYLLGEMMASQLLEYIRGRILTSDGGAPSEEALIGSPAVGTYLIERVFAPGARRPWNELIAAATDEPLNPAYFVRHLRGDA